VTGGGLGFGAGIAQLFAAEGARLLVADIDGARAERVAGEIGAAARASTADVAKGADFARMVREALDAFGRLDVVVNNAGTTHRNQPLLEVDEAAYDRVFAVNVKSIYWSVQHALPVFRRQGGGCFVNIASTAGLRPRPGLPWYNATKGAVIPLAAGARLCDLRQRFGTPGARVRRPSRRRPSGRSWRSWPCWCSWCCWRPWGACRAGSRGRRGTAGPPAGHVR
jgi:NAD(P)-dependent dehydrogenase (short-subunit alcohol dehydrogenase family)